MLAAVVVIPTIFALTSSHEAAVKVLSANNTGLAFTSLATLFSKVPHGTILGACFFLALFFAATTSLISMTELTSRTLIDFGKTRESAVKITVGATILFGIPSAIWMKVFENQDWVWGVGLLVSGLFMAICLRLISTSDCANEIFHSSSKISKWLWQFAINWIIPVTFIILTGWWLYQGTGFEKIAWWQPFARWTPGTVFLQWSLAILVLYFLNGKVVKALSK